jgi:uncharacterized RDD family membrane protein YckC
MIKVNKAGLCLRVFVALAVASTFVWFFWFQKGVNGYFLESKNGRTHVEAGSDPTVVLLSLLGIALFCILTIRQVRIGESQPASLPLRFTVFLFDSWFSLFTLSSIFSLPSLLLEAYRTGTFQWHFERDYSVPTDTIEVVLILVYLAIIVLYFVLPLVTRRQTLGCWIFRLATVNGDGDVLYLPFSTAAWRVLMEFSGLIHPIRTVKERDSQGRTWYDRETGLTVVRY